MVVLLGALRALFPLLRLRPWVLSVMVILGVLTALSEGLSISLFIPLVQSQMGTGNAGMIGTITTVFRGIPAETRLLWIGLTILLCVILKNVLSYSYSMLFQWVNASISHRLRCGILHQLLSVSQSYLDTHDSGKLLNTLSTDTWRVSFAFSVLAGMIINGCMTLTLGLLLFVISWKLTLITGCLLLFISQITQYLTREAKRLGGQATAANTNLSQRILETFGGLRVIRAFGRERHEQDRFEAASREVSKIFQKMESVSGLVHPLSEVPTATLLLGILVIMAMRTPGQMAASMTFLILLYRLQPRIKQFDADYNQGLDWDSSRRALDVISEKFVQDAVGRFGRGRTVLMIAHRIGTIEHADKVIVFDAGRVVESGSVPQLLAMGGLFSQFFALQLRKRHAVEELQAHLLSA